LSLVVPPLPEYLLSNVRIHFANIGLMRALWADTNPAIRVTARSVCALLAKRLVRKDPLEQPELAWLGNVIAKPSNTIYDQLKRDDFAALDNMNIDAFVCMWPPFTPHQTEDLPSMQETAFADTHIAILMNSGTWTALNREVFKARLSSLISRVGQPKELEGPEDRSNRVVDQLRRMFQIFFPADDTATTSVELPSPKPGVTSVMRG
jgi:hypothetical protein